MAAASARLALATPLPTPLIGAQFVRSRLFRPLPGLPRRLSLITGATRVTTAMPHRSYSSSTIPSPPLSKKPRFSYNIAASFIAKDHRFDPSTHVFHFNPYNRIQPPRDDHRRLSSRPDSGQDAFFVSRVNDTGAVAFGVADGVGGWIESGVNPADFSHGICDYMASAAWEHQQSQQQITQSADNVSVQKPTGTVNLPCKPTIISARKLMQVGYDAICADELVPAGGSTACVAIAGPDGDLEVANLGDSGFLQLRLSAVHTYSEPQTHAFNTPFQLTTLPPSVAAQMAAYGSGQLCDLPHDADVSHHSLRHGDVIMLATDGVFDNLFNQDILRIASRVMTSTGAWSMSPAGEVQLANNLDVIIKQPLSRAGTATTTAPLGKKPERAVSLQSLLATEIVLAAKRASVNTKQEGPFGKEVQRRYPSENWHGGKVDDICVVVAVVTDDTIGPRSNL